MAKESKPVAKAGKSPKAEADVQQHLMEFLTRAIKYRKLVQKHLGVDDAGLTTMIHLVIGDTNSPSGIAQNLDTSTAATTLVLNRLEASGHITRKPHPLDGRKVVLAPTKESLTSVAKLSSPINMGLAGLTKSFSKAEQETISRFLLGVIEVYDKELPQGKNN